MSDHFDPYYTWLGIPPEEQPPDHYVLLGIRRFEENPDTIAHAADRQMSHVRQMQTGKHGADSQRMLNQLAAARICLSDEQKKAAYDAKLRSASARTIPSIDVHDTKPLPAHGRAQKKPPALLWLSGGAVIAVLVLIVLFFSFQDDPNGRESKSGNSKLSEVTVSLQTQNLDDIAVAIDGNPAALTRDGRIPQQLAIGKHHVKVTRPRFRPFVQDFDVTAGKPNHVIVRWTPQAMVTIQPQVPLSDTTIDIDGHAIDLASLDAVVGDQSVQFAIEPGEHVFRISRVGFQTFQRAVVIQEGALQPIVPTWIAASAGPTTDLLALIDPAKHAIDGDWQIKDGALITPYGWDPRLQIPYTPPDEYQLTVTVERLSGSKGLHVLAPVGEKTMQVYLDGFHGSGVYLTNKRSYHGNETSFRKPQLHTNKPVTLTYVYRKTEFQLLFDGQVIVDWPIEPQRLYALSGYLVADQRAILISVHKGVFKISKIEITPISGEGKVLDGVLPAVAEARKPVTLAGKKKSPPVMDEPSEPERLPIPSSAAQQKITAQVAETYELAELQTSADRLKLARDLLDKGLQATDRETERFVLLRTAMDLSCEGGDARLMLEVIDTISNEYDVVLADARRKMLLRFGESARDAAAIGSFVDNVMPIVDDLVENGEYATALTLAKVAHEACRGTEGNKFRKQAFDRRKEVEALHKRWQEFQRATATLQDSPEDSAAHLVVGSWYCFDIGEWKIALEHFRECDDDGFRNAATLDSAGPTDASHQIDVAQAWLTLAEDETANRKHTLATRSEFWYEQALPKVTSVVLRDNVKARLARIAEIRRDVTGGVVIRPKTTEVPSKTRSAPNWALEFDGDGDYVLTPIRYDGRSPITVEAIVTARKSVGGIFANQQESGVALAITGEGYWKFDVHNGDTYSSPKSDELVVTGKQVHLAGVFDGRTVRLYVDGRMQKDLKTLDRPHKPSQFFFMIGADPNKSGSPEHCFDGRVNAVHVAAEALSEKTFVLIGDVRKRKSTVLLYTFKDGPGSAVRDESGNNNHGRVVGAKWAKIEEAGE